MTKMFKKVSSVDLYSGVGTDLIIGKTSETIDINIQESHRMNMNQQPMPSQASTKISEGLQIVQREVGQALAARFDIFYDDEYTVEGGYTVHVPAEIYVINHPEKDYEPSIFISSLDDPETVVTINPAPIQSGHSSRSCTFNLPDGISVPFRLMLL